MQAKRKTLTALENELRGLVRELGGAAPNSYHAPRVAEIEKELEARFPSRNWPKCEGCGRRNNDAVDPLRFYQGWRLCVDCFGLRRSLEEYP